MYTELLSNLVIHRVCLATSLYTEENARGGRRNRSRWGLLLKYEGETVYTAGDASYRSDREHAILLPMGSTYEWRCTRGGHYAVIEFESDLTWDGILSLSVRNSEKLLALFREMENRRSRREPLADPTCLRELYSILLYLAQDSPRKYHPTEKQQRIAPALDYIEEHYAEKLTNDRLAALTGLSTPYFRKLFAETVGASPIDYLHGLRIRKAMELLKSDYSSVGAIAHALGYPNIYDFSRAFKARTGLSPTQYKAREGD